MPRILEALSSWPLWITTSLLSISTAMAWEQCTPEFQDKFQGSAGKGMRMHRNAPWSSLLILDGLTRIMLCGRRCQSLCWRLWLIFPARPAASHGWFCGMKLLRALEWSYLEGPESCQEIIMGYLVNSFVSGLFLCDLRRCGG